MEISLIPDSGNVHRKVHTECLGNMDERKELEAEEEEEVKGEKGVTRFTLDSSLEKKKRTVRQRNTWWTLSDGTIWCESGFDSRRKTD